MARYILFWPCDIAQVQREKRAFASISEKKPRGANTLMALSPVKKLISFLNEQ